VDHGVASRQIATIDIGDAEQGRLRFPFAATAACEYQFFHRYSAGCSDGITGQDVNWVPRSRGNRLVAEMLSLL